MFLNESVLNALNILTGLKGPTPNIICTISPAGNWFDLAMRYKVFFFADS